MKVNHRLFSILLICSALSSTSQGIEASQFVSNAYVGEYTNDYDKYLPACSKDEFRCSDGVCIAANLKCNGVPECAQGDDETDCSSAVNLKSSASTLLSSSIIKLAESSSTASGAKCPNSGYKCQVSLKCIPPSQLCDGEIQCLMADDELNDLCKLVPGYVRGKIQKPTEKEAASKDKKQEPKLEDNQSSTDQGLKVDVNKQVPSAQDVRNSYVHSQGDPGFVFVNFGPIIAGDKNVNGNGNDVGNGNNDGNNNGNGNGNGNGVGVGTNGPSGESNNLNPVNQP